eukprot:CAMPEP_0113695212 /NCGR_PEP_ID=MMETSP0038_2-20120614/20764_1 /TAXON_ID=2898 /ORGANISM="Cryptomonas paramecium" /LENGTH=105 /DNA_ID=CAMNT_0000617709 /DNA_START=228 /DNA_END=542 /DNA_ORIENTATION=+ /assembly_acc=CAM_ASM_000170
MDDLEHLGTNPSSGGKNSQKMYSSGQDDNDYLWSAQANPQFHQRPLGGIPRYGQYLNFANEPWNGGGHPDGMDAYSPGNKPSTPDASGGPGPAMHRQAQPPPPHP